MTGRTFIAMLICSATILGSAAGGAVVQSPDGEISLWVRTVDSGQLAYRLERDGQTVIGQSALGVTVDDIRLGQGVSLGQPERWTVDQSYPWRGVHSVARNHFRGVRVPVRHERSGSEYTLEVRVFNDGAGFRYLVPGEGKRTVAGEDTTFQLPAGTAVWYQTNTRNYEEFYRPSPIEQVKKDTFMGPPAVVELPGGGYAALTEAALFDYSGMTLRAVGGDSRRLDAAFQDDETWEVEGTVTSPWRVIIVASDLNGLVNSDVIHNLNEPPSSELASADWIRPGRGFWHWWSGTIGNWDSVAFEKQFGWIDHAADFGFEHYLVDAGWEHTWSNRSRVLTFSQAVCS